MAAATQGKLNVTEKLDSAQAVRELFLFARGIGPQLQVFSEPQSDRGGTFVSARSDI